MDVYAALADPVRRSLLEQLAEYGACRVVDLTAGRGISRPAVSRHLRVLGEAGLVQARDVGRERHYRLETAPLQEMVDYARRLGGATPASDSPTPTAAMTSPTGALTPADALTPAPPVGAHHLDALDLEVRRTVRERGGEARHTGADDDTEETA
ncbi:ArsR/SmtB family transcription factor [Serinicoccus sediminis]|uniref:ArsR/SmtB family transcription factor n=1 Tax=Serinicoccus sediminis TaxID=2306021 RepID=UPI00101E9330|nr:metalloregulator ArsR/SmtB family transcription factor [Serinicoccus sediminis]